MLLDIESGTEKKNNLLLKAAHLLPNYLRMNIFICSCAWSSRSELPLKPVDIPVKHKNVWQVSK